MSGRRSDGDKGKGARGSKRRKAKGSGKGVSLRPEDAVSAPVDALNGWKNEAPRDDRLNTALPTVVSRALESFALKAGRSTPQDAVAFGLLRGIKLLPGLPGVSDIRRCRKEVALVCSDDLYWFEHWDFDVAARKSRHRWSFRKIDSDVVALCGVLARELGLDRTTVVALALMRVLVEVDEVPDQTKRDFLRELRRFIRELKKRVIRAEELRIRSESIPRPSDHYGPDDILNDPDNE